MCEIWSDVSDVPIEHLVSTWLKKTMSQTYTLSFHVLWRLFINIVAIILYIMYILSPNLNITDQQLSATIHFQKNFFKLLFLHGDK